MSSDAGWLHEKLKIQESIDNFAHGYQIFSGLDNTVKFHQE